MQVISGGLVGESVGYLIGRLLAEEEKQENP